VVGLEDQALACVVEGEVELLQDAHAEVGRHVAVGVEAPAAWMKLKFWFRSAGTRSCISQSEGLQSEAWI
jgi:hypothetical protein